MSKFDAIIKFKKEVLSEMEFAFRHGFTNIEHGKLPNNNFFISGTFGFVEIETKEFYDACLEIHSEYHRPVEEKDLLESLNLTDKELEITTLIITFTHEYPSPVNLNDLMNFTTLSKSQVLGIISDLYLKGIIEDYLDNQKTDMFCLNQEMCTQYVY